MKNNNFERNGKSILYEKHYNGLKDFFEKVWNSSSEYIVILDGQCSALNNVFLKIAKAEGRNINTDKIITNEALFLYVDDFVKCYLKYGFFPNITVVDNICFNHGHIWELLWDFWWLIRNRIEVIKNKKLSDSEEFYAYRALFDEVNIYSYTKTDYYNVEVTELARVPMECYTDDYGSRSAHSLSIKTTEFLLHSEEGLDSYYFSMKIPNNNEKLGQKWQQVSLSYLNRKYDVHFKNNNVKNNFIPVVYTMNKMGFSYVENKNYSIIKGLCFLGDIKKDDLNIVCDNIVTNLKKSSYANKTKFLVSILERKEDLLCKHRLRLISFMFSVINVYDYCFDLNLDIDKCEILDIEKYAINFGLKRDTLNEFELLCKDIEFIKFLRILLYNNISKHTEPIKFHKSNLSKNNLSVREYNDINELIFYRARMEYNCHLHLVSQNKERYFGGKWTRDVLNYDEYFSKVVGLSNGKHVNLFDLLASQIVLIDGSVIDLGFFYNEETGIIQQILRSDTQSMFFMSRRLSLFLPAFNKSESLYYGEGIKKESDALKVIAERLLIYIDDKNISTEEKEDILFFKNHWQEFIDYIYRFSPTTRSWNIPESLSLNIYAEKLETGYTYGYLKFLTEKDNRADYYIEIVKDISKKYYEETHDNYYDKTPVKKLKK